jgi:hypothetical protein
MKAAKGEAKSCSTIEREIIRAIDDDEEGKEAKIHCLFNGLSIRSAFHSFLSSGWKLPVLLLT